METHLQARASLPSTEQLLVSDGDARIALDPISGLNKYGCQPFPDPHLLAFGSSTATVISEEGFAAADRLRQKLLENIATESYSAVYARQIQRIRREWLQLCGLSDIVGLELIFSASGTDIHAIAAQYTGSGASKTALAVMVEANETGSGIASAMAGNAFNREVGNAVEVVQISIRLDDGASRAPTEIDAEVEILVCQAVASGRRVLLILVDQSKTGLIAPSPACVMDLYHRFPNNIDVLVDACQFRIALPTLRAYLEQGFMVALTGSKFLTAPSFSAALLLPSTAARRLRQRAFPCSLASCSSRANWPINWPTSEHLNHADNFGLLLRFEVALEEMRRFRSVPQTAARDFLLAFAASIRHRLISDPHFEPLPVPQIDRRPLIAPNNWDHLQTIFPFLLYHNHASGRIPLSREETLHIYHRLPMNFDYTGSGITAAHDCIAQCRTLSSNLFSINGGSVAKMPGTVTAMRSPVVAPCIALPAASIQSSRRYQLGQPVACGTRNGLAVSALRLCISSRLIIEATTSGDKGISIIKAMHTALDKIALLIQSSRRNSNQHDGH